MKPHHQILLATSLVVVLAACTPSSAEPSSVPSEAASPSPIVTPSPSLTVSPEATPSVEVAAETALIEIQNFAFSPASLTISAGTEVTVTNLDSAPHTFTAGTDAAPEPDLFDSGLLQQGESFTFVFDEAGTFIYFCDRHPPMQGEITVTG